MDLNTQSYVPIPMNSLYTPTAFDYDPTDGRIYFVDYRLRQLMSVHFSGTDVRELKQLDASMNEIDRKCLILIFAWQLEYFFWALTVLWVVMGRTFFLNFKYL